VYISPQQHRQKSNSRFFYYSTDAVFPTGKPVHNIVQIIGVCGVVGKVRLEYRKPVHNIVQIIGVCGVVGELRLEYRKPGLWVLNTTFNNISNYIVVVSFNWRKPEKNH
jgi:hypothetical protein